MKTPFRLTDLRPRRTRILLVAGLVAVLGACSNHPVTSDGINDPYEASNRKVHNFNVAVDQSLFGGGDKKGAIPVIPGPVRNGIINVTRNLWEPDIFVNGVLQGDVGIASLSALRFGVNSTIGLGGIFNVTRWFGMPEDTTDFGETLYVWGVPEGAYLELPFWGPTTQRDIAGSIVDLAINPMNWAFGTPESYYVFAAYLGTSVGNRQRYADTVESVLYDSADSYAQTRLLYLQNRAFALGEEAAVIDPYEDPYAQ